MTLAVMGALLALALVDSTSIGTLGIPVVLLLAPRIRVSRVFLYLGALGLFYFLLGVPLLLGLDYMVGLGDNLVTQGWAGGALIAFGVLLVLVSFVVDGSVRRWLGKPPRPSRWRARVQGAESSGSAVVLLALGAGAVEAASMLPYIAAMGLISSSGAGMGTQFGVLAGYVVVMMLPALILLGARVALNAKLTPLLERVDRWITKHGASTIGWVVGIVGVLIALQGLQMVNG